MERLLTLKEVCQRLQISMSTVRRLIRKGELSVVQVGKQHRIEEQALQDFIERSKKVDELVCPA